MKEETSRVILSEKVLVVGGVLLQTFHAFHIHDRRGLGRWFGFSFAHDGGSHQELID
jgi:hypothetical protein